MVVRSDLPRGFLAAQIVHAAGETSNGQVPPGTNAVVLAVPDEETLSKVATALSEASVPHTQIREPDPPYFGQLTAIGLFPVEDRAKLKPILSKLPLLI